MPGAVNQSLPNHVRSSTLQLFRCVTSRLSIWKLDILIVLESFKGKPERFLLEKNQLSSNTIRAMYLLMCLSIGKLAILIVLEFVSTEIRATRQQQDFFWEEHKPCVEQTSFEFLVPKSLTKLESCLLGLHLCLRYSHIQTACSASHMHRL